MGRLMERLMGRWQMLALAWSPRQSSWYVGVWAPLLIILPLLIWQSELLALRLQPWLLPCWLLGATWWTLGGHGLDVLVGRRRGAWSWLWLSAVPRWQWLVILVAQQSIWLCCQWLTLLLIWLVVGLLPMEADLPLLAMGLLQWGLLLNGWVLALACWLQGNRAYWLRLMLPLACLWLASSCCLPYMFGYGLGPAVWQYVPWYRSWLMVAAGTGALSEQGQAACLASLPTWPSLLAMLVGWAGAIYAWLGFSPPMLIARNGGPADELMGHST